MLLAIVFTLLVLGASTAVEIQRGICVVQGTSNEPSLAGTVAFDLLDNERIQVEVNVVGFPTSSSSFAIHVHEAGDLSVADGTSTGGHFVGSPGNDHACEDTDARHVGDMGNWDAAAGAINQTKTFNLMELRGTDSVIGRAVTIHAGIDDCVSQPTGAAGARLGVCVIGIANPGDDDNVAAGFDHEDALRASVILQPTANCPGCSGAFFFEANEDDDEIEITGFISGLDGGDTDPRGVHVHAWGDLTSDLGSAAGGHYNPDGFLHNLPPVEPRHRGDLGAITGFSTSSPGSMYYSKTNTWITSVNSILGRSIIVHLGVDNGAGEGCDQAGSSGARVLQGVIGIANVDEPVNIPNGVRNLDLEVTSQPCVETTASSLPGVGPVPSTSSSASAIGGSSLVVSLALFAVLLFV